MNNQNTQRQSYYSLFSNSLLQNITFVILFLGITLAVFKFTLPFIQDVIVEQYLEGDAINDKAKFVFHQQERSKNLSSSELRKSADKMNEIDYYTRWEIIIYKNSEQEATYWFNPMLSLFMPIALFSFFLALMFSSFLPNNIGLMSKKIEREILNTVDNLHHHIYNRYSDDNNQNLEGSIISSDQAQLLRLADEWQYSAEDLRYLQTAVKWKNGNIAYRILNSWKALKFYLRFYFTDKYSNVVLGLVYIGAAVLIIIIGMRGLKFIPSTQPSLVFFALGLEFSVLLTYAFTVIYSRSDNEVSQQSKSINEPIQLLSDDFGNSKEVENLLRAFLRDSSKIKN